MIKHSAVILSNDVSTVEMCLKCLSGFDEIIVVEDNSSNDTTNEAKKLAVNVYKHKLNNDFSAQRNFGLQKAKGEWVLFIDADERVSPQLAKEILQAVSRKGFSGFRITRQDVWMGKSMSHGEFGNISLLRLAKRNSGKWVRAVHEQWEVKGKVGVLKNVLVHYPHPTVYLFIQSINRYSKLHALANLKEGKTSSPFKIVIYPLAKFVKNFILKKGYRDGTAGFVAAVIMSFHSYLSWATLWSYQQKLGRKSSRQ